MIEEMLSKFEDKALNKMPYAVTVAKKEKPLNNKNYY